MDLNVVLLQCCSAAVLHIEVCPPYCPAWLGYFTNNNNAIT